MRLPRDLGGIELAKKLERYGYQITRQTGSHICLTTQLKGEHHITIPQHKEIRVGTLKAILVDVADHFGIDQQELMETLFGNWVFKSAAILVHLQGGAAATLSSPSESSLCSIRIF